MFRGRGDVPEIFAFVELSERFGWTYEEIMDQPEWYIRAAHEKLRAEARRRKLK